MKAVRTMLLLGTAMVGTISYGELPWEKGVCKALFKDSDMGAQELNAHAHLVRKIYIVAEASDKGRVRGANLQAIVAMDELTSLTRLQVQAVLEHTANERFLPTRSVVENFRALGDWDQIVYLEEYMDVQTQKSYEYLWHYPGDNETGLLFNKGLTRVVAESNDGRCHAVDP